MSVPTVFSDQMTKVTGVDYQQLKPTELYGRKRSSFFTYTSTALAAGSRIAVTKLPANARILGGYWLLSATLGASTTLSVGLAGLNNNGYYDDTGTPAADSDTLLLGATASTGTTKVEFANTVALKNGYITTKEVYLVLATAGATLTAGVTVQGEVEYVVD